MPLQDLVNLALDQRRRADFERAKADALFAATIGEAERLRSTGVSVRELDSDQRIGTIRLDGANKPAAPAIEKLDELASWLAERVAELVRASLLVPVDKLEEVLELLELAGLRDAVEAKVELRDLAATLAWLGEHCKVQGDPQVPNAWNVLHVDSEGHTTPVPGVTARKPQPTWKAIVEPAIKADAVAVATSEAEELVRELRAQDALDRAAQAAAVDADRADVRDELAEIEEPEPSRDAEGYTVDARPRWHPEPASPLPISGAVSPSSPKALLVQRARELGLPSTGTREQIAARINSPRELVHEG